MTEIRLKYESLSINGKKEFEELLSKILKKDALLSQKDKIAERLKLESKKIKNDSLKVLHEFEVLENDY